MEQRPPSDDGEWRFTAQGVREIAKRSVAELAARQFGRIRVDQIRRIGVSGTTIRNWRDAGYLHPELPRVYAVGHPGRSTESDLAAAILYAGPGAMLSHGTAAWWLGLLRYSPKAIHLSTPRRIADREQIVIHGRRALNRIWHRGLPVTDPSQTIIDFAATDSQDLLRLVLANADYQDLLEVQALARVTGVAGARALREALRVHLPELADTRSRGERLMLYLSQESEIPIPEINVYVQGWLVDAHWPEQMLVVEIDGYDGHRTRAQLELDHRRDLELRAAGYTVLRYTVRQLIDTPQAVVADIRRYL